MPRLARLDARPPRLKA